MHQVDKNHNGGRGVFLHLGSNVEAGGPNDRDDGVRGSSLLAVKQINGKVKSLSEHVGKGLVCQSLPSSLPLSLLSSLPLSLTLFLPLCLPIVPPYFSPNLSPTIILHFIANIVS